MQIVIDIPEKIYTDAQTESIACDYIMELIDAVKNGTPLPKGHGNLIQREDAETIFKNTRKALLEQSRKEQIKDLHLQEIN